MEKGLLRGLTGISARMGEHPHFLDFRLELCSLLNTFVSPMSISLHQQSGLSEQSRRKNSRELGSPGFKSWFSFLLVL